MTRDDFPGVPAEQFFFRETQVHLDGRPPTHVLGATPPLWIDIRGPDATGPGWVWDCYCTAYDVFGTVEEAEDHGARHGWNCEKGKWRYENWR